MARMVAEQELGTRATARAEVARGGRILALDLARSGALLAMAVYHFVFDLEMFGWLLPGTSITGGWRLLAVVTAGSFLFLAGVSLWLAQGGLAAPVRRWRAFWRRFAKIAGAAALITAGTAIALPEAFIFFGILHAIAAASLIGMAVIGLPVPALIGLAALVYAAPSYASVGFFDPWWFWFTGLQTVSFRSVDYVPLFPWLAPFLVGLAAGRIASQAGLWARIGDWQGGVWVRRLAIPGRHSLLIYLLHQPVLIGIVALATFLLR